MNVEEIQEHRQPKQQFVLVWGQSALDVSEVISQSADVELVDPLARNQRESRFGKALSIQLQFGK